MPRLPTMRVIGSQFISTRLLFLPGASFVGAVMVLIRSLLWILGGSLNGCMNEFLVRPWMVSGGEFSPRMTPLGFLVDRGLRHGTQSADRAAIGTDGCARDFRAGRLIHEGHELVRETGHGAANANAAYIGTSADSGHPS